MNRLRLLLLVLGFGLAGIQGGVFAADDKPQFGAANRDKDCTRCHDANDAKPVLAIYQTKHGVRGDARTPGCQTCHGDSASHIKDAPKNKPDVVFSKGAFEVSDDKTRSGQCLTCHTGKSRNNWDGSQHQNNQLACNDCHKAHAPADKVMVKKTQTEVCFTCHKEQRAQLKKVSTHPTEVGKVVCSDCHNTHGSPGPAMVKKNTIVETCYTCHAEKRGPFLFEHQPVTENCANCHSPHGSNIAPMLITRSPFICQSCHDGPHTTDSPVGRNAGGFQSGLTQNATGSNPSSHATGRGCLGCHSVIHGSNSPSGGYFQR
ncbi:MAG: DmsE family decaheme c-type cytochrome [Betaproteobacteria bacterium]